MPVFLYDLFPPLYTVVGTCWFISVCSMCLSWRSVCLSSGFYCAGGGRRGRPSKHETSTQHEVLTSAEWILASTGDNGPTFTRHWVGVALYSPPAVHAAGEETSPFFV